VNRVLVNFLTLSASTWLQQVLNFLTVLYLARALGADAFGQIAVAQAVVLYFRLGSDLGLDLLGGRRVAQDPARVTTIVGAFTAARVANAALAVLLLLLVASAIHVVRPIGWVVAAFGLLLAPLALSLEWAFSGLERMAVVGTFRVVVAVTWLVLVLVLVRGPDHVLAVPLANAVAMSAGAFLLYVLFRRRYGLVAPVIQVDRWLALVREAAPIGLSLVLIQIYVGFGVIAIGLLLGERAAGLYAAPQRVVLFLTAISSMFGAALYPRLSALHGRGRGPFERQMAIAFRAMLLVGLPLGVGGALVAPSLMAAVYPAEYEPGGAVLRWLVLSVIPIFATTPFGCAVLAAGRQQAYFRAAAAGAAANVALTLALVPHLRLLAPVAATLVTETLVLALLVAASRDLGRVNGWRAIRAAGTAAAVMAAALAWLRPPSLVAQVLLGAGVYGATLFVSGGLTKADLEWATGFFRSERAA
jgi:O-antigen/teichoic acid export membrane protein